MVDVNTAVRFVDDFLDGNPKTRDSCPGKVNGNKLIPIANQIQRRTVGRKSIKHIIFIEQGTRNIWYKKSICDAGVVKMGFSLSELRMDARSVPMEVYAKYFIDRLNPQWLKDNDFEFR